MFLSKINTIKDSTDSALKRCFITGVTPVTLDDLTSGFNIDLFLRPELECWPDIEHSYIVELKHVKMREGRNMVEVRRKEALLQAQRYAASPDVQEAIGHTRLHKVIVVFYGMEMAVCEEV